ncbi:MBL fold metallo-hydrolase [Vannielia litorea]|uniref:L-ascorbate metabolism protein UlaG, beta-lactamase superfamily n=1 Tax=Vannielia litorea TaxID=1217970 RepID=A0A1N6EBK6_9RHOB|nr:MBL fold metallo-hydrolase [Vannielia litorea]SIN80376.1 L-ascorbate metabolism protein UlaG, beta-lactamase superfamily [Vannielia litorea]
MFRPLVALVALAGPALAQDAERRASHCIALVENVPGLEYVQKAAWTDPVGQDAVRITYVDHSVYVVQTQAGLAVATDYNGYLGPEDFVPDVATMNHAHGSHWTPNPDPRIPHVLQGWGDGEGPAAHHLDLGEMLVRNVPTDIRSGYGGVEEDGNSIFVFEVAGLCIGHLGHLHHEPNAEQYAALGRLDIVMAPVDGGMTVDIATMQRIISRLRSSVVLPMHWFSGYSLEQFLEGMAGEFVIERRRESSLTMTLRDLPSRPTIVVLQPLVLSARD